MRKNIPYKKIANKMIVNSIYIVAILYNYCFSSNTKSFVKTYMKGSPDPVV